MNRNIKIFRTSIITLIMLLSCFYGVSVKAASNLIQNSEPNNASETTAANSERSLANIVPFADALKEEYSKLDDSIAQIKNIEILASDTQELRAELKGLEKKLKAFKASATYGFERVSLFRIETRTLVDRIGNNVRVIGNKLSEVEKLRATWREKRSSWEMISKSLSGEVSRSVNTIIKNAISLIKTGKKSMIGLEIPLVKFQQEITDLYREGQQFLTEVDEMMSEMKEELFERSHPAMFTPTFLSSFNTSLWKELLSGLTILELPNSSFYSTYAWVFILQFILILMSIFFLRKLKQIYLEKLRLDFILQRYITTGILIGFTIPLPLFEELPDILKLFQAAVIIMSSAHIIVSVIKNKWQQRAIYSVVILYLMVLFFTMISLPSPLLRLFIAIIGIAGFFFCELHCFSIKKENHSKIEIYSTRLVGFSMLIVFLSQISGYAALANHLFDIAIKTIFLGLTTWILSLILRGTIEMLLDSSFIKEYKIIKKNKDLFINHFTLIVDVLIVFFTFSSALSVWGFFDSPGSAISAILSLGVQFHQFRITLSLLISAIIALWLSLLASWVVRNILNEEVYPRKHVERGVGISINRLIQYAFIVIGFALASSTLGIGMQNITVIVGALGIGIGFGLQNIVNNFASGLILLFERSIKMGDIVQINGQWGVIKNLGLRATIVETYDHSEVIVPNSDLVSSSVTNWTLTDRQVRLIIPIGIAYGSDILLVTKVLNEIAQSNSYVMKFPAPVVLFLNFGNSSLNFELRVWIADIDNLLKIQDELNREVDRLFHENNIEIPFNQYDLNIRTMDKPFKNAVNEITGKSIPQSTELEHPVHIPTAEDSITDVAPNTPD